jgi:hypothetical protein
MRMPYMLAVITLMVASNIGVAAAAESGAMSKTMAYSTQSAKGNLMLSRKQENAAWNDIRQQVIDGKSPSNFTVAIGAVAPSNIMRRRIPDNLASAVPILKHYQYALHQDKILIINPSDNKVVEVIGRH